MSNIDNGGPAFPVEQLLEDGMTLRDYMAIHATDGDLGGYFDGQLTTAEARYAFADDMLAARKGGAA